MATVPPTPIPLPPPKPVPVTPSSEQWRAMTPAQRERFIIDVNEALSDQKVATLGAWLQERAETQARDLEDAKTEVLQLKRDITLRCLRVHKISCSPDNLARLEACTDSKTLTAWLERAYEATSEADVFG